MGVIAINEEGDFQGFIGAQKVTISALDIIWRRFQTEEQRKLSQQYVSTEFNNITIDEKGFIYVTTSSIDENQQQAAIRSNRRHLRSGQEAQYRGLRHHEEKRLLRSRR